MEVLGMDLSYNKLSGQTMPHREYNRIAGASPVNVGKYERIGSALLGGFLLFRAIKNRSWTSLLTGSTGMSLLGRGVTGVCPMYKRMSFSSTNT